MACPSSRSAPWPAGPLPARKTSPRSRSPALPGAEPRAARRTGDALCPRSPCPSDRTSSQAEVRRDEHPIAGDLSGEADRAAVDVAHLVRVSDRRELLLARVEGERLQDFGTRVEEFLVELLHRGRTLDDDLGRERTRLHVAAFLEFEQVAAIAEDHALFELIENAHLRGSLTPASVSLGHDRREGRRRLIV